MSKLTPLRITRQGGQVYLGGSCARFGCGHPITQHDFGVIADRQGGPCRTKDCKCPNVYHHA